MERRARLVSWLRPSAWMSGAASALALVILGLAGGLAWLERPLYDMRCRLAPAEPPGTHVVHIDIDDNAMIHSEKKDLSRADMAAVVDELTRAGASVIVFDMLFEQPSPPAFALGRDGKPLMRQGRPILVDDDDRFAKAIARSGRVVLGAQADPPTELTAEEQKMLALLTEQPAMPQLEIAQQFSVAAVGRLNKIQRLALENRLDAELAVHPTLTEQQAGERILGGNKLANRQLERRLHTLWADRAAQREMAKAWPQGPPTGMAQAGEISPPLPVLATAAAAVGGVNRTLDPGGTLRSVPMGIPVRNGFFPPLSLQAACLHLGIKAADLRWEDGTWILPGQPTRRIPTGSLRAGEGGRPGEERRWLRWPTSGHWENWNAAGHLSIGRLWEIPELEQEMNQRERESDEKLVALAALLPRVPLDAINDLRASLDYLEEEPEAASDPAFIQAREERRQALLEAIGPRAAQTQHGENYRKLRERVAAARQMVAEARAFFAEKCKGRVCLVGWAATGGHADVVTTPQMVDCPGACVHGVAIENILSSRFTRRAPMGVDLAVAVVFAALAVLLACRLPLLWALGAFAASAMLLAGAGFIAFTHGDWWLSLAWPITTGTAGFLGAWLLRAAGEVRQRRRITAQFRNYVSPALVDHLIAHPELASLKGEKRRLTCVFTDFAGFTTVSQQLGAEATARLLNAYLSAATSAFIASGGNVNKFLGDGILVFWGAPLDNADHARDACRGLLACRAALSRLAVDPALAGLPALTLRAGCVTDEIMVGDFGAPPQRSDYTVIGDGVNLASRLESANKQLGTTTLIGEQTALAVADEFLLRPIAHLRVVGRTAPEPVFELLAFQSDATARQREQARCAVALAEAFAARRFADCLKAIEMAEALDPGAPWLQLHRAACERHLADPSLPFDVALSLTRK